MRNKRCSILRNGHRQLLKWAVCLFATLVLCWTAYERTDGFSLSRIESPLPFPRAIQEVSASEHAELIQTLSQPFRYLGKGRQSFVFESADEKTVIKFFNQTYFKVPFYARYAQGKWAEKEKSKRALRKDFYLNSYRIALSALKEESGIVYLHLGPEEKALPSLRVADKANRWHEIDLNHVPFVLQKKGEPLYPALAAAHAAEGLPGIYGLLDLFVEAIAGRIAQGIGDADCDVEHNWGVLENRIFHLDPGRLYLAEDLLQPDVLKLEWRRATRSLSSWLQKRYPEAAEYLNRKVEINIEGTSQRRDLRPPVIFQALRKDE